MPALRRVRINSRWHPGDGQRHRPRFLRQIPRSGDAAAAGARLDSARGFDADGDQSRRRSDTIRSGAANARLNSYRRFSEARPARYRGGGKAGTTPGPHAWRRPSSTAAPEAEQTRSRARDRRHTRARPEIHAGGRVSHYGARIQKSGGPSAHACRMHRHAGSVRASVHRAAAGASSAAG